MNKVMVANERTHAKANIAKQTENSISKSWTQNRNASLKALAVFWRICTVKSCSKHIGSKWGVLLISHHECCALHVNATSGFQQVFFLLPSTSVLSSAESPIWSRPKKANKVTKQFLHKSVCSSLRRYFRSLQTDPNTKSRGVPKGTVCFWWSRQKFKQGVTTVILQFFLSCAEGPCWKTRRRVVLCFCSVTIRLISDRSKGIYQLFSRELRYLFFLKHSYN